MRQSIPFSGGREGGTLSDSRSSDRHRSNQRRLAYKCYCPNFFSVQLARAYIRRPLPDFAKLHTVGISIAGRSARRAAPAGDSMTTRPRSFSAESAMEPEEVVGFMLRVGGQAVSFHQTLVAAQDAATCYPAPATLMIQTTHGAVRTWDFDRVKKAWVQRPHTSQPYGG